MAACECGRCQRTSVPQIGQIAIVPFGRQELAGVIVGIQRQTEIAPDKIKDVLAVRHQCPPVSSRWLDLCRFAADYYQRPLGEVAVPALPRNLRALKPVSLDRNLKKLVVAESAEARPSQG